MPRAIPCTLKLHPLSFTRDLKAQARFLPLATFLRHSPPSVPESSTIQIKCLNSDLTPVASYLQEPPISIPPAHLTPSPPPYLHWLSDSYSHIPQRPTIAFRSSSDLPQKNKLSAYKRPSNPPSLPSSPNLNSILFIERGHDATLSHNQSWNSRSQPILLLRRLD